MVCSGLDTLPSNKPANCDRYAFDYGNSTYYCV